MIDHTAEHDPLCRGTYQRFTPVEHCASCDLIHKVRIDMMNKFRMTKDGEEHDN